MDLLLPPPQPLSSLPHLPPLPRSSNVKTDLQRRTPSRSADPTNLPPAEASAALVGACKPKGISSVVFGMVEGEPVLTSAHWDAGGLEYFATLFMSRFFPQSAQQDSLLFFAWPTQLARVDVWTFWARLCEQGAALNPLHDRRGVFPLVLNRGATSFLIAIATSDEDLMALKDIADAALHEETEAAPLKLESWVDSNRRIWCNGPRPEYSRQTQRYNMPARTIPLVRKGLDYIVLPGGYEPIREFAEFVRSVFDLEDDQILWTPGEHYLLDDDIAKDPSVVARLKQVIVQNSSDKFTLLPYAVTNHFQEWSNQLSELGVSVFGETIEWISK